MRGRPSKKAIEEAYDRGYRAGQNVMADIERAANPEMGAQPVVFDSLPLGKKLQLVALRIASDTSSIRFAASYLEDARSSLADSMEVLNNLLTEVESVAADPFGARDSGSHPQGENGEAG